VPDIITLPEVTVTKHRDRARNFRWELGPDVDSDWAKSGEPGVRIAQLSVSHDKDRKEFDAFLSTLVVTDRGNGMVGERYSFTDSGVMVWREPVPRFSAKRLDTFADWALARLESLLHHDTDEGAKVRAILEVS
jgi:hypothetical protein